MTSGPTYELVFGDDVDTIVGFGSAQAWLEATVRDLKRDGYLPGWRAVAMLELVRNMPRAGTSFYIDTLGIVVKCQLKGKT